MPLQKKERGEEKKAKDLRLFHGATERIQEFHGGHFVFSETS